MVFAIITLLLFLPYAGVIIFYRVSWEQIPSLSGEDFQAKPSHTTISIIIAARNEEKNIGECILSLINQSYPEELYEIILIDDHSTDSTVDIIKSFKKENLKILFLKDFITTNINSYKKKGIEIAISKAKNELIITTDADCIAPQNWLKSIAFFYEKYNPVFIASPVAYSLKNRKVNNMSKLLMIFETLDFMVLQGITGGAVYKKFHSMCNGANLAYKKEVFYEAGGFNNIDNIASGDDMLLMNKIRLLYPEKVMFLKSKDAIIKTKPTFTIEEFINQRIRWASKVAMYNEKKIKAVLFLVYFFNLILFRLGIFSIFYYGIWKWFFSLLFLKTIVELFFLYPVAKFFNQSKLLWWFPLAEPFHIVYTIVTGWLGKFGSYKWKGRQVK